jgi:hypothetical protein
VGSLFIVDSPALQTAVAGLYATFAPYPLGKVAGCPHCVYPQDIALIHSAPMRALSAEQLEKYGWKAMTTWGDVADFKHFAPRLFEIAIYDDLAGFILTRKRRRPC